MRVAAASAVFVFITAVPIARAQTAVYVPSQIVTASGADNPQFNSAACGGGLDCRFAQPSEVATDSAGNIIVADTDNRLVKAFDPTGQTLLAIYGRNDSAVIGFPIGQTPTSCWIYDGVFPQGFGGIELTHTDCFSYPSGVAVDSRDRIYVTDAANHRVMVFCPVASVAEPHTSTEVPPGCPALSAAPTSPTSLQFITAFGTFGGRTYDDAFSLEGPMGGDGQFSVPIDVAVDRRTDRVYVLDQNNNRVQAFDLAIDQTLPPPLRYRYVFRLKFGSAGTAAGQFAEPSGLTVDQTSGNIIVAQYNTQHVDVFDPSGAFTNVSLGVPNQPGFLPGEFSTPLDAAVDSQRRIWVVDSDNGRVQVFSAAGALLFQLFALDPKVAMAYPYGVEVDDARQRVLVADASANRIGIWRGAALGVGAATAATNPAAGSPFAVTITITNLGEVPLDNVQPVVTATAGADTVTIEAAQLPSIATLAPGARATFTVPLTLLAPGAVTLSVSATGLHTLSNTTIDAASGAAQTIAASLTIAAAPRPAISVTSVQASVAKILAGRTFSVTVEVTNAGDTTLAPPQVTITATGPVGPSTVTIGSRGHLAPGATRTFTWTYTASAATSGTAAFMVIATAGVAPTGGTVSSPPRRPVSVQVLLDLNPPTTRIAFVGLGRPNDPTPQMTPNAAGFFRQPVRVTWTATDDGGAGVAQICYTYKSPQAPICVAATDSPLTFLTSIDIGFDAVYPITYFSVDTAGNREATKTVTLKIDQFAPIIQYGVPTPRPNANGWNNTAVTLPVTVVDNLSGVASTTIGGTPLPNPSDTSIVLAVQGRGVQTHIVATDLAGNTTMAAVSPAVNIDLGSPTIQAVIVNGTLLFPAATPAFPNGVSDPAPPAALVAGVTVDAFVGSQLDPATLPPPGGIPLTAGGTWTLCDLAGNCTTALAQAELVGQFDVAASDDGMFPQYEASGPRATALVPTLSSSKKNKPEDLRTYSVLQGGNGIALVERVRSSKHDVQVDVLGFRYTRGCPLACEVLKGVVPAGTTRTFKWSQKEDGSLDALSQQMTIGGGSSRIDVQARWDSDKNRTEIHVKSSHDMTVTLPGLVLLQMATKEGHLVIRYDGNTVQ